MAVNTYECLFLLDPNKASADLEGAVKSVTGILERHGANVVYAAPWGDSRLAYSIEKFRKGTYVLTYFTGDSVGVAKMDADFRLSELILRQLVIKLHPKIAADILAHINGEGEPAPEEAEEAAATSAN